MTTVSDVKVPDIGDFNEVEIIEIHIRPGDRVSAEDPLLTLESDKATMDIPSPSAGTVKELRVAIGDKVSEGDSVLTLETSSDADGHPQPQAGDSDEQSMEADGESSPMAETPPASQMKEEKTREKPYSPPPTLPPPVERARSALPHASPSVRRFARELAADLTLIRGSGAKDRILKQDVKEWVKQQLSTAAAPAAGGGTGIPPLPEIDFSKFGDIEVHALPRIKKISGPHLHRAWLNVPHVTHHDEADITELEAFRKSLQSEAEQRGARVTLLSFVMLAVTAALKEFPQLNSSLSPDGESLIYKKYFHLGVAVDTPDGLMVPVFRDVDKKSVFQLAEEMADVSQRARAGKIRPDELQGGCMSISSLGGIGGTAFTPIVNAPEVAILGITRSRMTPVWNSREFAPRLMLPLDLSYDHRVIDGATAARFVTFLGKLLEDMRRLLL